MHCNLLKVRNEDQEFRIEYMRLWDN